MVRSFPPSVVLFLGCLVLLAAERVGELWLSRRNARLAFAEGGVEVGRGHYPAMALFHTLFLLSCAGELLIFQPPFPPVLGYVALGVALGAQALRYWAVFTLGVRWNTRIVIWPQVAPVTTGPYRFLRHPNYLAVVPGALRSSAHPRLLSDRAAVRFWQRAAVGGARSGRGARAGRRLPDRLRCVAALCASRESA